ncbi:MAG: DUF2141 domain-containing protein [Pseudomonadota bacterium]
MSLAKLQWLFVAFLWGGAVAADDDLVELFSEMDDSPSSRYDRHSSPPAGRPSGAVASIEVTVSGIRNDAGKLFVFAFNDEVTYRAGNPELAVGFGQASASRESVALDVAVVGNGPFALMAFHDENDDGQMNLKGQRPTEGYGYSNGMDYLPPRFERAVIEGQSAKIRILYLPDQRR